MTEEQFYIGLHRIHTFGVYWIAFFVIAFLLFLFFKKDDGSELFIAGIAAFGVAAFYGLKCGY